MPLRIHLVVSFANQRFTTFIQIKEVGVKWNLKRGWRTSQRWIMALL